VELDWSGMVTDLKTAKELQLRGAGDVETRADKGAEHMTNKVLANRKTRQVITDRDGKIGTAVVSGTIRGTDEKVTVMVNLKEKEKQKPDISPIDTELEWIGMTVNVETAKKLGLEDSDNIEVRATAGVIKASNKNFSPTEVIGLVTDRDGKLIIASVKGVVKGETDGKEETISVNLNETSGEVTGLSIPLSRARFYKSQDLLEFQPPQRRLFSPLPSVLLLLYPIIWG